jgi:VWFA-related protein
VRLRSLAVAATTAVLVAPAGALSLSTQAPTFPSGVELVRIDVVVVDKDGRPVTGLTAADFEITEGGKRREIASFEPVVVRSAKPATAEPVDPPRVSSSVVPVPEEDRYFLIFFDDVHVGAVPAERVRAQLAPFLERETREGDWVTVVSPLAGLKWTARTAFERLQLSAVIRALKGQYVRSPFKDGMTDFQAMRRVEYGGRDQKDPPKPWDQFKPDPDLQAEELYAVAKRRIRRSLGALDDAVAALSGFRGRKTLIFYSEGFILSPSMREYEQVIERARRARVSVHFVDPRGLGTGADEDSPDMTSLDSAAAGALHVVNATGGRAFVSNDLTIAVREAEIESTAYYFIGFQPAPGALGERRIKVRVRRDGLKVRAPDRYFVGDAAPPARAVPPAVQALAKVADATDIPIRAATLFLDDHAGGEPTTTLAVELPGSAGDMDERRLTLLVEARPLGEGEPLRDTADVTIPPGDAAPVATRELHLHPGVWQARVVVRDPRTEKLGSLLHTFEVPDSAGLRVSTPILGDRLEKSRVPRARLRLDRRFRRSDALYCQYRVFGAALDPASHRPRVTGSYTILRDGQTVQEGAATLIEPSDDGGVRRLIGLGLADFPPGDYTLVLRVRDQVSTEAREIREPFNVQE